MDLVGHLSKELGGLRLNLTPGKVPLNHHLLLRVRSWDLCLIVDEVDAGAVVPAWWFHDPPLLGVVSQRLGELAALLGQYQALLQEVKVVPSELDLHCLEAAPKAILTSDLGEACEQDACYKRRSLWNLETAPVERLGGTSWTSLSRRDSEQTLPPTQSGPSFLTQTL